MEISRDQAASALREVEAVAERSQELAGYAAGAPVLIMWGVICMIGYGAGAVSPTYSVIWLPLCLFGAAATAVMSRRRRDADPTSNRIAARIGWTWAALVVFYFAAFAVLRPHEINQVNAFPALLVALSYAVMGIWTWRRYLILGALVAALTLLGYFLVGDYYGLWMAAVMGGGLILGGLWLRKV